MPTTPVPVPVPSPTPLRIHRPPDADSDEVVWMRYGRLPNGAPAGCLVDVAVHREHPPKGVDAGWHEDARCWISLRLVDPLDEEATRKFREGHSDEDFPSGPTRFGVSG